MFFFSFFKKLHTRHLEILTVFARKFLFESAQSTRFLNFRLIASPIPNLVAIEIFWEYPTRPAFYRTTAFKPYRPFIARNSWQYYDGASEKSVLGDRAGQAFSVRLKNRLCVSNYLYYDYQLSKARAKVGDKVLLLKLRCCKGKLCCVRHQLRTIYRRKHKDRLQNKDLKMCSAKNLVLWTFLGCCFLISENDCNCQKCARAIHDQMPKSTEKHSCIRRAHTQLYWNLKSPSSLVLAFGS